MDLRPSGFSKETALFMESSMVPTNDQRAFLVRSKLPVPETIQEATYLINFILHEGDREEIGERIKLLREQSSVLGAWVSVRSRTARGKYAGKVVRLRVRSSHERGHLVQTCKGDSPPLYVALVQPIGSKECYQENLSCLCVSSPPTQLSLFDT